MNMSVLSDLRPSPIAGLWYDGRPKQLAEEVDRYIAQAELPVISGEIVAVVAPHAGHRYSGPVAGYAFAAVRGQTPDIVAVVSPMHHAYVEPLLTSAHAAYETPLGTVPIDKQVLSELDEILKNELGWGITPVSRDPEHSLEIELPFLQRALKHKFTLLPVMVRTHDEEVVQTLGRALAKVLRGKKVLLVASTDLSHFYTQEQALVFDTEMLHRIETGVPEKIFEAERYGKGFACGHAALAAVMWAAQGLGANHIKVLNYATSGDVTGDYSSVVGYGAAVVTRNAK
jgi:AmmeMemoRadiSam system protein B